MTTENIKEQPAPVAKPHEQEPFGYFHYDLRLDAWVQNRAGLTGTPFYTSPPPQRKPLTRATIADARDYLNTNDKAMWVLGWNECVEAHNIKETT